MKDFFSEADFLPANLIQETKIVAPGIPVFCFSPKKCAEIANRLLRERGKVVYGQMHSKDYGHFSTNSPDPNSYLAVEHTALLICVEPIERDSADGLLKELLCAHDRVYSDKSERVAVYGKILERAKRLLEGK